MDMTDKEFNTISHTKEIKMELNYGITTVEDQLKALENKVDVDITLAKEEIQNSYINDILDTHKILMRYLDNVSLTTFVLLITSCITIIICIVSVYLNNYNILKICLPLFAGCVIGCINHVCQIAKKLSIEFFRLSEFLKRRKTK